MNTSSDWIPFLGFALAALTSICGAILWHVDSEKKKYGAQRDFNHLKRNIEQMSNGLVLQYGELEKHLEEMKRDILEIKIRLGMKLSDRTRDDDTLR